MKPFSHYVSNFGQLSVDIVPKVTIWDKRMPMLTTIGRYDSSECPLCQVLLLWVDMRAIPIPPAAYRYRGYQLVAGAPYTFPRAAQVSVRVATSCWC